MKVATEREWQEARQALLVAERELEGRAKRVEEFCVGCGVADPHVIHRFNDAAPHEMRP